MPFESRICWYCGTLFRFMAAPSSIRRGEGKFCSCGCSQRYYRTGKPSNNWQGGRAKCGKYIKVFKPNHPHVRADGYVLEHRLIMEQTLQRPLLRQEVVHHKNGNTTDNRPENLELLTGQSNHMKRHRMGNRWRAVCATSFST